MKKLKGWDAYVAEAMTADERTIELPLTDDECYIIHYPSRNQAKALTRAQREGDVDAMLVALLGEEPGNRVAELSAEYPSYVLDELIFDVMRAFGFVVDEEEPDTAGKSVAPPKPKSSPKRAKSSRN